jgi:hypothetical protein
MNPSDFLSRETTPTAHSAPPVPLRNHGYAFEGIDDIEF